MTSTPSKSEQDGLTVFIVNSVDNPDATLEHDSFDESWTWITAPEDWEPEHGIPGDVTKVDLIVVFTEKYEEPEAGRLCEAIRRAPDLKHIRLLVAVNQYEMPLANRVKKMPGADFVFTPVSKEDLFSRLAKIEEEERAE